MVCADTNVWIAFLAGEKSADTETLAIALRFRQTMLAPPVVAELLSYPELTEVDRNYLAGVTRFSILPGFWDRSAKLRMNLILSGNRPKLADTLIAQVCIDHRVPLLTRDRGFSVFAKHAGLALAK